MASSLARAASYGSLNRVASHGSLSRAAASPAVNSPPAASPARASPAAPRRAPARVAATPADGADIAVAGPAPASPAPRSKVSAGAAAVLAPPAPASFQPHPLVPPPVHPELLAALSPAPPQLPPVAARELPIPAVERARFGDVYAAGDLLGRGTFGDVRSATEVATGRRVAVKELPKRIGGRDKREVIMQEVRGRRVGAGRLLARVAAGGAAGRGPWRVYSRGAMLDSAARARAGGCGACLGWARLLGVAVGGVSGHAPTGQGHLAVSGGAATPVPRPRQLSPPCHLGDC